MSQDFGVYIRRENPVTPAEMIRELSGRGIEVVWKSSRPNQPELATGDLYPAGPVAPSRVINLATRPLPPPEAASLVSSYQPVCSAAALESLSAARFEHMVSAGFSRSVDEDRLLGNLIEVLGKIGNGVIIDMQTNQCHDPAQFRQLHPGAFS